jgi:hypothetical protein
MRHLQTSKTPRPARAQRFAQLAKAIAVHIAQGFDAAKFLPLRDHSLEGFFFSQTGNSYRDESSLVFAGPKFLITGPIDNGA